MVFIFLAYFLKNTEGEVSPGVSKVMGSKPSKVNDVVLTPFSLCSRKGIAF